MSVIHITDCEDSDKIIIKASDNENLFCKKLHHDSSKYNGENDLLADMKEGIGKDENLLPFSDSALAKLVSAIYYEPLTAYKIKAKQEKC